MAELNERCQVLGYKRRDAHIGLDSSSSSRLQPGEVGDEGSGCFSSHENYVRVVGHNYLICFTQSDLFTLEDKKKT